MADEHATPGDANLLGTGYDGMMVAALAYVTRPASEVRTKDSATHWVGMPEYQAGAEPYRLIVSFPTAEARETFVREKGLPISGGGNKRRAWSCRWPDHGVNDHSSLRFEGRSR